MGNRYGQQHGELIMAVRTPLYWNGSALQAMSNADINTVVSRAVWEYRNNPSVTLSVVSSGGSLGTVLTDTRLQAGAYSRSSTAFPSEATTAEPSTISIGYATISQSVATISAPTDSGLTYPVYWNGSAIQAMTLTDFYDTFIYPALSTLVSANSLYTVSTSSSVGGYTLVSSTPVFTDTRADTSLYTSDGIPETLDQPTTIANYYLHRINAGAAPSMSNIPTFAHSTGLQAYSDSTLGALVAAAIRYVTTAVGGYQIRFNINGGGTNTGTITNTVLNGSGNYQTRFVHADEYRAQEFPNGSAVSNSSYLRVQQL